MKTPRRRTIAVTGGVLLALAVLWAGASWHRHQQRKRFEKKWALVQVGMTQEKVIALLRRQRESNTEDTV